MNRVITLLIILLYTSNLFGEGLTISISNKKKDTIAPGSNVTYPIKLTNSGSANFQVFLKTNLPENWSNIVDQKLISIEPGQSIIKLLNIKIPSNAIAGSYNIHVSAYNDLTKALLSESSTNIEVTENIDLEMNLIDVPEYIKSGETIYAKALLKSNSNKDVSVRLQPRNCTINGEQSFVLEPGENKVVDVTLSPYTAANSVNNHSFGVKAMVAGTDSIMFSTTDYINVVPSEFQQVDERFKYPVYLKASYLTRYFDEGIKHALQGEAYGSGYFSEKSKNYLEFRFRGPNTYTISSLGKVDEYYVQFKSSHVDVLVGDHIYRVTPLSEPGRYARGVAIAGRAGGVELKAYYNQPRFYPDIKQTLSGSATYSFNKRYKIGVHYLAKEFTGIDGFAQIGSVTGEFEPIRFTKLVVEYSRSQSNGIEGNGVYGSLNSRFWRINLSGFVIYADKDYTGYYNNTLSYVGNFSINITKGLSLNANFQRDERNAERDTLFATAPYTVNYRGGFTWIISKLSTIRGFGGSREREDLLPGKKFHYQEIYGKLEYNQFIKKFAINLSGEVSQTTNYLIPVDNKSPSYGIYTDIGYRPRNNINVSAFVSYRYDNRYSSSATSRLYYGVSLDAWFTKTTHLYFRFQNAYALEEYYRDRDFFTLMFSQLIGRNQEVSVRSQYGMLQRDLSQSDLSVELSYTYYLGIPVGNKKIKYGKVVGSIKNQGVSSVEGIVLHLNSHTTVTDAEGGFVFEKVMPGSYYLVLDKTSVTFQDITDRPMPLRIEVQDDKDSYVELGLTRSTTIKGVIEMVGGKPLPPEVSKTVVELRRGQEIVKAITDEKGNFRFSGVRPGTWEIRMHSGSLPGSYYFEESIFEFDIEAGENITLPVKLFKKEKVIKLKQTNMRVIQLH